MTRFRLRGLRRRRLAAAAAAAAVAVLAGGCGPTVPTQLGVANYASHLALGETRQTTAPTPAPAAELQPGFPPFIAPPPPPQSGVPRFTPIVIPTLQPCPTASPGSAASDAAPAEIAAPPTAGVYSYRQTGYYLIAGLKYPALPRVVRTLSNVKDVSAAHDGSDVLYQVVVDEVAEKTTTTYEVKQPAQPALGGINPNLSGGGIYLFAVDTVYYPNTPSATTDSFHPTTPVEIAPLPMLVGAQFAGAGADGQYQEEMDVKGTVVGHHQVDACGTLVDTWQVSITGHVVTATSSRNLAATYDIATQMGGLSIGDEVATTGATPASSGLFQDVTATIDSVTPSPVPSP